MCYLWLGTRMLQLEIIEGDVIELCGLGNQNDAGEPLFNICPQKNFFLANIVF